MRRLAILSILLLSSFNILAADPGLRLEGIAYSEGGAKSIEIQVWALGGQVSEHPEWQIEPVFARSIPPGKAFAVDLGEAQLPVQVELAAEGHVGVALQAVIPEQLKMAPAWLRPGVPISVRVSRSGEDGQPMVVWGGCRADRWDWDYRRWRAVVPHEEMPAGGSIEVVLPPDSNYLWLAGVSESGDWGRVEKQNPTKGGAVHLEIDSESVPVRVWDQRKRPAAGIRVAVTGAPLETFVVTDEQGRAAVQVPVHGEWRLTARGDTVVGTVVGRGKPQGEVDLDLAAVEVIQLRWPAELGTVVMQTTSADPFGKTPAARSGGSAEVEKTEDYRGVSYWGPRLAAGRLRLEEGPKTVPLGERIAATIEGRVVADADTSVAGIPVWVRLSLAAISPSMNVPRGRAARLERPWMPWAVTDEKGRFSVQGLAPVECDIEVRAPGLPTARSERLVLEPGATEQTTVTIRPGAWLGVRAVDAEGLPLSGVTVEVARTDPGFAQRGMTFAAGERATLSDPEVVGSSDAEGRCRLESVPVGSARVRLSRPGLVPLLFDGIEIPPEGLDLGDQVLEPGVTLVGTTVGPDGEPVESAEVAMDRRPPSIFFGVTVTSGDAGRFTIPDLEASGELYLRARAEGLVPEAPLKVEMPPKGDIVVAMAEERVLEGRAVDARDGSPIEGAATSVSRVRATRGGISQVWPGSDSSETDADGGFRVSGLSAGEHRLSVEADGMQPSTRQIMIGDENPEPVLVELEPGLELRGRVESADGEPVGGVTVWAGPASREFGSMSGLSSRTQTDVSGRFEFDTLGPGKQRLYARDQNGKTVEGTGEAGQLDDAVLRFPRETAISGTVFDPDGAPVAGATVQGYNRSAQGSRAVDETGPNGRFELQAASAGEWDVSAHVQGFARAFEKVEVREGEPTTVDFHLQRGAVVVGDVRGLSSTELGNCWVHAEGVTAKPQRNGSFRLEGVPPGDRTIQASTSGSRERSVRVEVPESGESRPVAIDFDAGLTISGRLLRRGSGVPGMELTVRGVGVGFSSQTLTASNGSYRVEGLEPGEYEVAAHSPGGETLAGDHVLLEADAELDLRIPGGTLRGRVLSAETREPVNGARVTVAAPGVPSINRSVGTDRGGAFEVADLGDADYTVVASAEGYSPEQEIVALRGESVAEVELLLGEEAGTVFVAREPNGSAPAHLWISGFLGGQVGPMITSVCDTGGRCEVRELPAGTWTLGIGTSRGSALIRVEIPGGEVAVQLRAIGRLIVRPGGNAGGAAWQVRLSEAATGLVLPVPVFKNPGRGEWVPVPAEGLHLMVPEGGWQVEAVAPDGEISVHSATVPGGGEATVELE